MLRLARLVSSLAIAALALSPLTGCHTNRLQSERNALWAQNQELQSELDRNRAALDAAMAERAAREAELARMRQAPAPAPAPVAPAPTRPIGGASSFRDIEGVEARDVGRNIELNIASDILFAPGKADLSPTARRTLAQVATVLKREHAGRQIVIEGHTDTDPIRKSKWRDNQHLSEARAEAVANYLGQQGVSSGNMQTVGLGSTQPRDTKARSRRVEITVIQ